MESRAEEQHSLANRLYALSAATSLALATCVGLTSCSPDPLHRSTPAPAEAKPLPTSTTAPEATTKVGNSSTTLNPEVTTPQTSEQCAADLPTLIQAGQVLTIGLYGDDIESQTNAFRDYNIGGAVLMSAPTNLSSGSIIRFKNEGDGLGVPLFISTDQEGGTVQRFANFGMPSAQQVAEKMTTAQAESMVRGRALELKSSGIDMDLAPLADVAQSEPNTNFLGTRIFSNNPTIVTAYDKAYVEGLEAGGILPTLKHFPDLGSANGDTDVQSAETLPIASMVQHDDLVPYATLASSGTAIMVGNAIVPGLTNGLPASLSPNAYSYLRTTLGDKNNLLITDALNATAITGITTEAHAVVDAISAGDDIALVVEDDTTIGGVELLMGQLEGAIVAAIKSGLLPEQRLAEAVTAKLAAQSINACTVLANIGT